MDTGSPNRWNRQHPAGGPGDYRTRIPPELAAPPNPPTPRIHPPTARNPHSTPDGDEGNPNGYKGFEAEGWNTATPGHAQQLPRGRMMVAPTTPGHDRPSPHKPPAHPQAHLPRPDAPSLPRGHPVTPGQPPGTQDHPATTGNMKGHGTTGTSGTAAAQDGSATGNTRGGAGPHPTRP